MSNRLLALAHTPWRIADTALRHADTDAEQRACFPVMKELRPHLVSEEDFMARITRAGEESYRILAAWDGQRPLALAGYRFQENLVYGGRFLYVDDLVSCEAERGKQWGARLLSELEGVAKQAGCVRLVLDTAMGNALAQRFYFRQGLLTGALRFGKPIQAMEVRA